MRPRSPRQIGASRADKPLGGKIVLRSEVGPRPASGAASEQRLLRIGPNVKIRQIPGGAISSGSESNSLPLSVQSTTALLHAVGPKPAMRTFRARRHRYCPALNRHGACQQAMLRRNRGNKWSKGPCPSPRSDRKPDESIKERDWQSRASSFGATSGAFVDLVLRGIYLEE